MIDQGDSYTLSVTTTDSAGVAANPTLIVCTVTLSDGTTATPAVTTSPVGTHTAQAPTSLGGHYTVAWAATGANLGAYADSYNVESSAWRGIISMADARAHLNWQGVDTTNDEELRFHLLTASAVVEDIIGPVVRRTIVERVQPQSGLLFVDAPIISLTSMTDTLGYGYTYNVANFLPDGSTIQPLANVVPPCHLVTVTYVGGRTVIDPQIRMAVLDLIRINWRPQQGGNYSAFDETSGEPMTVRLGYFVPVSMETGLLRAFGQSAVA